MVRHKDSGSLRRHAFPPCRDDSRRPILSVPRRGAQLLERRLHMKSLHSICSFALVAAVLTGRPTTTRGSDLVPFSSEVTPSGGHSLEALEIIPVGAAAAQHFIVRGNKCDAVGDHRGAIAEYTRALEISPEFAAAYVNRAIALKRIGELDAATADCNRALALNTKHTPALTVRGGILQMRGEVHAAIADFSRALTFAPGDAHILIARSTARGVAGDFAGSLA